MEERCPISVVARQRCVVAVDAVLQRMLVQYHLSIMRLRRVQKRVKERTAPPLVIRVDPVLLTLSECGRDETSLNDE